jgi:hypothetical protein
MARSLGVVVGCLLVLTGCAGRSGPVRIYPGERPLDQVALLSGFQERNGENFPSLLISEVDRQSSQDGGGYAVEAYVLPGKHAVKFRKINSSGMGWHSANVVFDAVAGHTYTTQYKLVPGPEAGKDVLVVEIIDRGAGFSTGMHY